MIHHERIEPLTGGEEDAFDVIEFQPGTFSVYQASFPEREFDTLAEAVAFANAQAEKFDARGIVPMTPREAGEYAPLWGSYITGGDSGAYMYSLDSNGLPPDQRHADAIISYIDSECIPDAQRNDDRADILKLLALRLYIKGLTGLPGGED